MTEPSVKKPTETPTERTARRFIDWLSRQDNRAFAVLRRTLGQDLEQYTPAFPYVEPFLAHGQDSEDHEYRRRAFYLIAGLYCLNNRAESAPGATEIPEDRKRHTLGYVVAALHREKYPDRKRDDKPTNPSSLEQRFIALLDADDEQRPHHLRQMVTLLKEHSIDWVALAADLLRWNDRTRQAWARDFYSHYLTRPAQESPETPSEGA